MCGCHHLDHFPLYLIPTLFRIAWKNSFGKGWRRGYWKGISILLMLTSHIFIFLINLFNWRIITILWWFFFFTYASAWISHRYTCVPPPPPPFLNPPSPPLRHPIPLGCPGALALGALLHALNLAAAICFTMVIYMFQCYPLKSSHPHLLPLSPKVCSLCLCLLCYPACRIVVTVFLNSIYMH